MSWFNMYIMRNAYQNNIGSHDSTFEWKLKYFFSFSWSHSVMQSTLNALVLRRSVTKKRTEILQ